MHVPFFHHDLGKEELTAIENVLRQPILSTGEWVNRFERKFSDFLGRKHTIGVSSGSSALHLAMLSLGIGRGDEVVTTPMTFTATASMIVHTGATPIFVDVESDTGNIDAAAIEKVITPRTKAILPVHLYGQMCDMRALRTIADRNRLLVIEDSAHCIEGARDGIRPGQLSDVACFSFYATKNMTCGEGGAIVTDHDNVAADLRLRRLHGINKTLIERQNTRDFNYDVMMFGWKSNMSNIQAAMLIPQFDRIDANLKRREEVAREYTERLSPLTDIRLPAVRNGVIHARHLFPFWLELYPRDQFIRDLKQAGVEAVVHYRALHLSHIFAKTFGHRQGDFPNAERIAQSTVSLPFYPTIPNEHVQRVCEVIQSILDRRGPA